MSSNRPPPIPYATRPDVPTGAKPKLPPRAQGASPAADVFGVPIEHLPPRIQQRGHTLQPLSTESCNSTGRPVQTQKFYANLILGSQKAQIFPLPYVIKWSGHGLDINHTEDHQRVFGPDPAAPNAQYYFCPVGIVSLSLTAQEDLTILRTKNHDQFSVDVSLCSRNRPGQLVSSIVRGSAFVTARYDGITPRITSGVIFRQLSSQHLSQGHQKWRIVLEDGKIWLIYALGSSALSLKQVSNTELIASQPWHGMIQVAKLPTGNPAVEGLFDAASGTFPTSVRLSGQVKRTAEYQLTIHKQGPQPALMYALPHHVEAFTSEMSQSMYKNTLASQTNGEMTLVWSDKWLMSERLPETSHLLACPVPQPHSIELLRSVVATDARQDIEAQIRGDSMYFCGKALNKLAQLTTLACAIQSPLWQSLLTRLEQGLLLFVRNQQQFPLIYEHTWGGVVSTQGFTERGDGSDFGNTWYNDHHYHYGYHVSSAALYLKLNPQSRFRAEIEAWAKMLIRDVASPMTDQWFPSYRSMDWFVGHSWSKGIYESADGKDEESSSEDYHFSYAMHLFAEVVGNDAMRDRAKIQLAVQRHAMSTYLLFSPDNQVVPQKMLNNCVSGIKFENKIDYTTYFGANMEYIHGIHILPITPITSFFRTREFVLNEWNAKLSKHMLSSTLQPGWRGLLMANIGLSEGEGGPAWEYLQRDEPCDDGVCRSWLLAMLSSSHA